MGRFGIDTSGYKSKVSDIIFRSDAFLMLHRRKNLGKVPARGAMADRVQAGLTISQGRGLRGGGADETRRKRGLSML